MPSAFGGHDLPRDVIAKASSVKERWSGQPKTHTRRENTRTGAEAGAATWGALGAAAGARSAQLENRKDATFLRSAGIKPPNGLRRIAGRGGKLGGAAAVAGAGFGAVEGAAMEHKRKRK